FLQPRVGAVAATLMFTAAHGAYGQPLMLVGILVISTVLSITFARSRSVLPCIAAHGVFDAIQMFVVIPWYLSQAAAASSLSFAIRPGLPARMPTRRSPAAAGC